MSLNSEMLSLYFHISDINKTTPFICAGMRAQILQPSFLVEPLKNQFSLFPSLRSSFLWLLKIDFHRKKKIYLDTFSRVSTIFFCLLFHFIYKYSNLKCTYHCWMSDNNRSFLFFVCFKSNGIFLRSNDLLSICCSAECNMQSMCRMRCMCFSISLRCFFRGNVSRLWQLSLSLVPFVAAEARQAKGQRQRWNTCTKSLTPRVHVYVCNTTFQCHPNELK